MERREIQKDELNGNIHNAVGDSHCRAHGSTLIVTNTRNGRAIKDDVINDNNWMSNIDEGFGEQKNDSSILPVTATHSASTPLPLGVNEIENPVLTPDKSKWLDKNRNKLRKGVFGPISKSLNAFHESTNRKLLRLRVYSSSSPVSMQHDSTSNVATESLLEYGAYMVFRVLNLRQEGLFTHIHGLVLKETLSMSLSEKNKRLLQYKKVQSGIQDSVHVNVMEKYEIILKSSSMGNGRHVNVGETIKLYEPWTIIQKHCTETGASGIIVGNDLILKVSED